MQRYIRRHRGFTDIGDYERFRTACGSAGARHDVWGSQGKVAGKFGLGCHRRPFLYGWLSRVCRNCGKRGWSLNLVCADILTAIASKPKDGPPARRVQHFDEE